MEMNVNDFQYSEGYEKNYADRVMEEHNQSAESHMDLREKVDGIHDSLVNFVLKEVGKGLSSNDYTDTDKENLENTRALINILANEQIRLEEKLENKVDSVPGKRLSTLDYTETDRTSLYNALSKANVIASEINAHARNNSIHPNLSDVNRALDGVNLLGELQKQHISDKEMHVTPYEKKIWSNNNVQTCANAVKETITGVYLPKLVLEDVSPVEHIVKLKVDHVGGNYDSAVVYVSDDKGTIKSYTPNSDGTVDGVTSFSPKMVIWVEDSRIMGIKEYEYNRDLNHVLSSMNDATEELQKPHTAELIETIVADGTTSYYERTQDLSGNPYNFKAMYVHIAIKPTVVNRIEVDFYDSHINFEDPLEPPKRLCTYQFSNPAGTNGFMSIHADVIGGMWQAIATSASNQSSPTGVQMWGEKKLEPYNGERIKQIKIKGATSAIASGATIKIYGVR